MKLRFDPADLSEQLALSRDTGTCTPALGALFLDAVDTMARGPQYRGYHFCADMRGDALVALLGAPRSFRADKCRDPNGWVATIIRRSFGKTIQREKGLWARMLRLAVDAGAEIDPMQLAWLRDWEAAR